MLYNLAKQNIDDAESGRNIITMAEFDQGSWKLKLYNVRLLFCLVGCRSLCLSEPCSAVSSPASACLLPCRLPAMLAI